jgi:hypothetical protein
LGWLSHSVGGLVGTAKDISADPQYPTDYKVGAVYEFVQAVGAYDLVANKNQLALELGIPRHVGHPMSRSQIIDIDKFYVDLVPSGARVEITEIRRKLDWSFGPVMEVRGRLRGGVSWAKPKQGVMLDLIFGLAA